MTTDIRDMIFRIDPDTGHAHILHREDGSAITRLDTVGVYPVGSQLSARWEHPEGIVLPIGEALRLGVDHEPGALEEWLHRAVGAALAASADESRIDPHAVEVLAALDSFGLDGDSTDLYRLVGMNHPQEIGRLDGEHASLMVKRNAAIEESLRAVKDLEEVDEDDEAALEDALACLRDAMDTLSTYLEDAFEAVDATSRELSELAEAAFVLAAEGCWINAGVMVIRAQRIDLDRPEILGRAAQQWHRVSIWTQDVAGHQRNGHGNPVRFAEVFSSDARRGDTLQTTRNYLPANYRVDLVGSRLIVHGRDEAGWTLDKYVIPRLASGLIAAREVPYLTV